MREDHPKGDEAIVDSIRLIANERDEDLAEWWSSARAVSEGIPYTNSIDDFLHTHRQNEKINLATKFAIALAIAELERASHLYAEPGRRDWRNGGEVMKSWMREFFAVLQEGMAAENLLRISMSSTSTMIDVWSISFSAPFTRFTE